MMLRRRRRPPVEAAPAAPAAGETGDLQRALRLGWAVAETVGRLRTYQPEFANKRNDPSEMPRFSYSNSDLSSAQQLEVSYRRLTELATALGLEPPADPDLVALQGDARDLPIDDVLRKRIHGALESWSRGAWIQLNVRSAGLGRAMTYGGSLADTYWYMAQPGGDAFGSGRQSVEALLRQHRLRRMRERMMELRQAFSVELCDSIEHSLDTWAYDAGKERWATAPSWDALGLKPEQATRTPPQQLHFNLFRQVRTWRDLIFEARQPLDYVSPGYRRRANLGAGVVTILMVVLVALGVGLGVFGAFTLALRIASSSQLAQQIGSELLEAISVFVSVGSTLAIVVAGLLARASRAVEQFDAWLEGAIVRRAIRQATLVPWNDPPRRPTD